MNCWTWVYLLNSTLHLLDAPELAHSVIQSTLGDSLTKSEVQAWNNILHKLKNSKWGADPATIRATQLPSTRAQPVNDHSTPRNLTLP